MVLTPHLSSIAKKSDLFCQTFDDGPTNVTSKLLDSLASENQKVTLFEIGSRVVENYLITQRAYSEGHEIAVHTWSHPHLTFLTGEEVYAELAWGIYAIHASIGQLPKLFRPPYGFFNDDIRKISSQLGLTVRSSYDFRGLIAECVLEC